MKCLKKRKPRSTSNSKPDQGDSSNMSDSKLRYFYPNAMWDPEEDLFKTRWTLPMKKDSSGKKVVDWSKVVIVIHHTAGWQHRTGAGFINSFLKRGLCTDFLDENGQIWQQRHGDRVGSHAGESKFKGKKYVSKFSIGLEIAAGGKLKIAKPGRDPKSWSKKDIPEGYEIVTYFKKKVPNARYVTREQGYEETGWYEPFTDAQEEELAQWIAHWMRLGVPMENVVGHDEVAGRKYLGRQRKNDPGGSLSMPLQKFVAEKVLPLV